MPERFTLVMFEQNGGTKSSCKPFTAASTVPCAGIIK